MFWDEVRFTIHCDASWYILVPQGQQPWGHVRELARIDRVEARDVLIEAVSACWDAPNWPLLDLFDIEGHPSNVPQQELREAVEAKLSGFDAPDLYREVLGNRSFEAASMAPAPPARREATAVAKPRSFIIIEVVSSTGAAVPGAYLELTTPDGAVRTLVTDAYGRAAAHDIDDGVCSVFLTKLDHSR